MKLDREEKEILKAYETGQLKSVPKISSALTSEKRYSVS